MRKIQTYKYKLSEEGHRILKDDRIGNYELEPHKVGNFHGFGTDFFNFKELGLGTGQRTVVIVEYDDGSLELLPLCLVKFRNDNNTT